MENMKHAYLIMAHNNYYCLEKLLLLLDDERNDIFLHIDKKVTDFDFPRFQSLCKKARILYPQKRINVRWGTQSQVKTEMLLFETAFQNGPYLYYHLLSGSDLPLKNQEYIHKFFDGQSRSYLFYKDTLSKWDIQRISRYHFPAQSSSRLLRRCISYINTLQEKMQVDRLSRSGLTVQRGYNWCSITEEAVRVLIANKRKILKMTSFSVCADEVYKQTILMHQGHPIVNNDLRKVTWHAGNHPIIYTTDHYSELVSSDRLFARKFDETVDREMIDQIFTYVKSQETCL